MHYFLKMIELLRKQGKVILYEKILSVADSERALVTEFLRNEYQIESMEYRNGCPPFDPSAACWAAEIACFAAQLILYRDIDEKDAEALLPKFESPIRLETITLYCRNDSSSQDY